MASNFIPRKGENNEFFLFSLFHHNLLRGVEGRDGVEIPPVADKTVAAAAAITDQGGVIGFERQNR